MTRSRTAKEQEKLRAKHEAMLDALMDEVERNPNSYEVRRLLNAHRPDFFNRFGRTDGRKRLKEHVVKMLAEQRLREEREKLWTYGDDAKPSRKLLRRRMIHERLLESPDITEEEERFYIAFLAGDHPPLPPILTDSPLWAGYQGHSRVPVHHDVFEWEEEYGREIPQPNKYHDEYANQAKVLTEVRRMRAVLAEKGLVITPLERHMRQRRGGYNGKRLAARLLKATRYFPPIPCHVHPDEMFTVRGSHCVGCRRELRRLYEQFRSDPKELAFWRAVWFHDRGFPFEPGTSAAVCPSQKSVCTARPSSLYRDLDAGFRHAERTGEPALRRSNRQASVVILKIVRRIARPSSRRR